MQAAKMRGDRPHSKENRQGNRFTLGPAEQPRRHSLMQSQCELGLKWLKAGEIEGMIFLCNNIMDKNLEAVKWTRDWIARVGDEPLK